MLSLILVVLAVPLLIIYALKPGDRTVLQRNLGLLMLGCAALLWVFGRVV